MPDEITSRGPTKDDRGHSRGCYGDTYGCKYLNCQSELPLAEKFVLPEVMPPLGPNEHWWDCLCDECI